jgi:Skp family chaperone for outer membrane proteins
MIPMKTRLRATLPTLLALVTAILLPATARAQNKIGMVDMNLVFAEYHKTKDAKARYEEAQKAAEKDLSDRVETFKKGMDEITRISAEMEKSGLGKDARDAKMKEREAKVAAARELDREISDFRTARQKALEDQFLKLRREIVEDILKAVNDTVKEKGYDLVLDKSGLSSGAVPIVLYSSKDFDFSKDVLAALNADVPKGN